MRLFLLPISTRRTLIYCEPLSQATSAAQQSYLDKAVNKANTTWASWESSNSSWKLKLTEWGNKMFRRIPFEEWGLKTIPGAPKPGAESGIARKLWEVRYPSLYQSLAGEPVMGTLKRLATERQPFHKQRALWCFAGMPCTIPFALLPIVPNIPFFYLVFRCWSHWTAWKGSKHLEQVINDDRVRPSPSSKLDNLYTAGLMYSTQGGSHSGAVPTSEQSKQFVASLRKRLATTSVPQSFVETKKQNVEVVSPGQLAATDEEVMLLKAWNGKVIAEQLELPGLQLEIERAVEQVEASLARARQHKEDAASMASTSSNVQATADEKASTLKPKTGSR